MKAKVYSGLLPSDAELLADGCEGFAVQERSGAWKDCVLLNLDVFLIEMLELVCN